MKKIVFLILLTLMLLSITIPVYANASTLEHNNIVAKVEQHSNIKSAQALVYNDNCIIAIATQGILTKSAYTKLTEQLTATLKESFPQLRQIVFTRSVKIYRQLESLSSLTTEQRNIVIEEILQRLAQRPCPLPYHHKDIDKTPCN